MGYKNNNNKNSSNNNKITYHRLPKNKYTL